MFLVSNSFYLFLNIYILQFLTSISYLYRNYVIFKTHGRNLNYPKHMYIKFNSLRLYLFV